MNKRNTFFKQVDKFINEYSIGQIILAGDYNDILSKIETKKLYQSKKFDKPIVVGKFQHNRSYVT
jgi:metallophosphoesterase superfamily enzyme